MLRDAVPMMYELKYQAQALMRIPSGKDDGTRVAAVDGPVVWALEKDAVDVEHLIRYRLTWLQ